MFSTASLFAGCRTLQRHAHLRHLLAEHPLQPCAPSSCPCWLSQLCVPAQQLPPACGGHPHWLPFVLPLHSPANQPSPLQEQRQALTLICRLQIGLPDNNQHVAIVLSQLGAAVGICMQMSCHKFIHGCDCALQCQFVAAPELYSCQDRSSTHQAQALSRCFRWFMLRLSLACLHSDPQSPT